MCHYGKKYFIGILQALQENATITKAWIVNMKREREKALVLISKCKGYFKTKLGNKVILVQLKPTEEKAFHLRHMVLALFLCDTVLLFVGFYGVQHHHRLCN